MRRILLYLFPLTLVGSVASAQPGNDETVASILGAVLKYVYEGGQYTSSLDTVSHAIQVDRRLFARTSLNPQVQEGLLLSAVVTASLQSVQGVSVVSAERVKRCGAWAPAECMDKGRSIVLSFGTPVIAADSAHVEIFAQVSVAVSPEDSASFMARGRNALSLRRASAGVDRAVLRKVDNKWVVQRIIALVRT